MLFCTVVSVYRGTGTDGGQERGRTEGGQEAAGGLAGGDTPLSTPRVGTIRGFGMQKFFFEFGDTGFG